MQESTAILSRNESKTKLAYTNGADERILLWERRSDGTLETLFDKSGAILIQRATAIDSNGIDSKIREIVETLGSPALQNAEFAEVRFDRPCPKCGSANLSRYVEAFARKGDVPVMPMYYCANCGSKSYYMTDSYLGFLVDNNRELLDESELADFEADKGRFLAEMREYIIRMFASKQVLCIK